MLRKVTCVLLVTCMLLAGLVISPVKASADTYLLSGARILLGNVLGVQYITTVPYDAHTRGTFTCNGKTKVATPENAGGYCAYTYNEIIPNEFELPVKLTVNGKSEQHTLKEIATIMLNSEYNDSVYEILSDMLRYCKASAEYMPVPGAPTPSISNPGAHFVDKALEPSPTTDRVLTPKASEDVYIAGFTYYFANYNKLCVLLHIADGVNKNSVKLTIGNMIYTRDALEPYKGNGDAVVPETYVVFSKPLPARSVSTPFSGKLSYNGTELQSYTYSTEAYSYSFGQKPSTSEQSKNLAYSLYYFGKSTAEYVKSIQDTPSDIEQPVLVVPAGSKIPTGNVYWVKATNTYLYEGDTLPTVAGYGDTYTTSDYVYEFVKKNSYSSGTTKDGWWVDYGVLDTAKTTYEPMFDSVIGYDVIYVYFEYFENATAYPRLPQNLEVFQGEGAENAIALPPIPAQCFEYWIYNIGGAHTSSTELVVEGEPRDIDIWSLDSNQPLKLVADGWTLEEKYQFIADNSLSYQCYVDFEYTLMDYGYAPTGYKMMKIDKSVLPAGKNFQYTLYAPTGTSNSYYSLPTLLYDTGDGYYTTLIPETQANAVTNPWISEGKLTPAAFRGFSLVNGSPTAILYNGDVNGNNKNDIADVNAIYQICINGPDYYKINSWKVPERLAADLNHNFLADLDDQQIALDYLNGVIVYNP